MRAASIWSRGVAVFDMGSVLIGWDVRPPYRSHFASEEELEAFLRGPFRDIYDAVHDGTGTLAECLEPVRVRYPKASALIDQYEQRWGDFVTGVMEDTVAIVQELHGRGVPLFGLTNWPEQVWPPQRVAPELTESLGFLDWFDDIWVSGQHKIRKPNPESYRSALARFGIEADEAVFVDDLAVNVEAAESLGLRGIHFRDADQLRRELGAHGLL